MYKLIKDPYTQQVKMVQKQVNNVLYSIPISIDNTDYANFKKAINEETAELQNADGNTMTAAEAKAYIATLP